MLLGLTMGLFHFLFLLPQVVTLVYLAPCSYLLANPYEPQLLFHHIYITLALILFHNSHRNNENSAGCEVQYFL